MQNKVNFVQNKLVQKINKVCILTAVHPAFDIRIFHKEAKTLAKAGYDVTLIAHCEKNVTVDEINILSLPKLKNRFLRILWTTWNIFRLALKQKADIYHFHDPGLIPVGLLLKLCRKSKVIYDVHEDVPKSLLSKRWLPKKLRNPISILINQLEKIASQRFDYIITATSAIKDNFKKHRVVDIKNYPIFANTKLTQKCQSRENKNCYTLIYTGILTRVRGIKEILQSLEFINHKYNVKLKLLGKFVEKKFEKEIKSLPEWNRIEFLGWLPFEKTMEFLEAADMGIICFWPEPNHLESVPNKMFEYMAAGLPVIASNFLLWKEIIEGNRCGLTVNPSEPKEIAKAVEYLIEHPEEAQKMGENGQKAVLEKYNWNIESQKLLHVYHSLSKKY